MPEALTAASIAAAAVAAVVAVGEQAALQSSMAKRLEIFRTPVEMTPKPPLTSPTRPGADACQMDFDDLQQEVAVFSARAEITSMVPVAAVVTAAPAMAAGLPREERAREGLFRGGGGEPSDSVGPAK